MLLDASRTGLPCASNLAGRTDHARRFGTEYTTDATSNASERGHIRTLPWAGILAGKLAVRVVLILWILLTIRAMLLDAVPCASF